MVQILQSRTDTTSTAHGKSLIIKTTALSPCLAKPAGTTQHQLLPHVGLGSEKESQVPGTNILSHAQLPSLGSLAA